MTRVVYRPTRVSGTVAIFAAAASVAAIANTPGQLTALGVAVGGVALMAVGVAIHRRGFWFLGLPVALVGLAAALAAVGVGITMIPSTRLTERVELVGVLAFPFLALGILQVHSRIDRRLVSLGLVFLVVGVILSGMFNGTGTDPVPLLVSLAAAVVAWDAGEQAINVGEQLGRAARTWPSEIAHSLGSVIYGGLGVGAGVVLFRADVTGLPIESLVLLLAAAVVLMVALYR